MFFLAGFGGDQGWLCRRPDSQILFPKLVSVAQAAALTFLLDSNEKHWLCVTALFGANSCPPPIRENTRFVRLMLLQALERQ